MKGGESGFIAVRLGYLRRLGLSFLQRSSNGRRFACHSLHLVDGLHRNSASSRRSNSSKVHLTTALLNLMSYVARGESAEPYALLRDDDHLSRLKVSAMCILVVTTRAHHERALLQLLWAIFKVVGGVSAHTSTGSRC